MSKRSVFEDRGLGGTTGSTIRRRKAQTVGGGGKNEELPLPVIIKQEENPFFSQKSSAEFESYLTDGRMLGYTDGHHE